MDTTLSKTETPWQLRMFRFSLKKQLKLKALLSQLGDVSEQDCLLITCGDNNGALNWHFRSYGGKWIWGDLAGENLMEMSDLLGETVHHLPKDQIPFADNQFDCIVSIDVLEHLADDQPLLIELQRVLKPGGKVIVTVPNGDPTLLANRIKWRLGMTPEIYGHTRAGYTLAQLKDTLAKAGFTPVGENGYSRFFTEMVELTINFGYVFVLSRKKENGQSRQIVPTSASELKTHGSAYRLYSMAFPFLRLVSKLDYLMSPSSDNAVIVQATKPQKRTV